MIGSELPKLKTTFYESHLRHCVLLFKGSTIHGKKTAAKWAKLAVIFFSSLHRRPFKGIQIVCTFP